MKKIMLSGCLVAALCFASGCDSGQKNNDAVEQAEEVNEDKAEGMGGTAEDRMENSSEFAVKAANGGMMEVELARLASTKATNQEVKKFAQMMMEDHMRANDELQSLATQKNITLPATLSDESRNNVERLSKLSGTDFDREYMDLMVEDHEEDVDLFKKAADDSKDAEIKAFAAKTLPKLENHLQMAKQTQERVNKKG
jgi:putative membrane protein